MKMQLSELLEDQRSASDASTTFSSWQYPAVQVPLTWLWHCSMSCSSCMFLLGIICTYHSLWRSASGVRFALCVISSGMCARTPSAVTGPPLCSVVQAHCTGQ